MKRTSIIVFSFCFVAMLVASCAVLNRSGESASILGAADAPSENHQDPITPVLAALGVMLLAGKLGGEWFERMKQPSVLGELVAGIVLGNLILLNPAWSWFEPLRNAGGSGSGWAGVVDAFARIGVIILLFEVGLESTIGEMRKVGLSATLVAVAGVIAPMILGYGVSVLLIHEVPPAILAIAPDFSLSNIHLFIGATLTATSVGITARVFRDLGKMQMREAKIVLGAAVIDDVLGLIVLGVVSGIVTAGESGAGVGMFEIVRITALALLFLGGSVFLGGLIIPHVMNLLARMQSHGTMVIAAILFCFLLSYLASLAGLAPIVGAFAAGLILEPAHFRKFNEEVSISENLRPVGTILVPLFFILMGIQVRLETFMNMNVLGIALLLTVAAIAGKQVCGWAVAEKGLRRSVVGVGMIPRGEVGLIFAAIGKQLKVVDDAIFSAIVIMVILTTFVTPPVLAMLLKKMERK